jgi:hypothetical protein
MLNKFGFAVMSKTIPRKTAILMPSETLRKGFHSRFKTFE